MVLNCTVVQGYGVASGSSPDSPYPRGSIELQKPFFKKRGVLLDSFFNGTLNLHYRGPELRLLQADFTLHRVKWSRVIQAEDFSFVQASLRFNSRQYPALIYYPHPQTKPMHHQAPTVLELLAPHIAGVHYGAEVTLFIASGTFERAG